MVGGMGSTILISFQKHALINFFACDRLDLKSPGETHGGNSSCGKLEEKKITTNASPCISISCSNISFPPSSASAEAGKRLFHVLPAINKMTAREKSICAYVYFGL